MRIIFLIFYPLFLKYGITYNTHTQSFSFEVFHVLHTLSIFFILKIKYTSRRIFLYVTSFISISKYFFSSFFFLQKYQYLLLCLSFYIYYIYIYICSKLFYYYTYVFADLYSSYIHISCVYIFFTWYVYYYHQLFPINLIIMNLHLKIHDFLNVQLFVQLPLQLPIVLIQ